MAGVVDSVLDLVGRTPLLALHRISEAGSARILAKLESLNPSGSTKDRAALAVVEDAEAQGLVEPGATLVWASSGNSAVALAMVAAAKGYGLVVFMPSNAPVNLRRLLQRFGVEVRLTSPHAGMRGSLEAAQSLARSGGQYLLLDLFQHPKVAGVHERRTAQEIIEATGGAVDAFVAGVGTGGTVTGVGRRLKRTNPAVQVIAVEPANSPVLSGGQPGRHMIPGIGADFVPPLLDRAVIDAIVQVTDDEANQMTLRLTREEGLLVGISSGANVAAAVQVARWLGIGKTVVTILADTGERYLEFPS